MRIERCAHGLGDGAQLRFGNHKRRRHLQRVPDEHAREKTAFPRVVHEAGCEGRGALQRLGINLDTGNYPGDPYEGIAQLAPHATIVQAKTYYGGGEWYTLNLDYQRIAQILRKANFNGWISLEMEGKEPAETAVPKSLQTLRSAFS